MTTNAAQRVTRYVREKVGDDLRTVVLITEDGWDGVYLRDDLQEKYKRSEYTETVEIFRPDEETEPSDAVSLPLGTRHASVFYHEEAYVFRFRYSTEDHILVSISPDASRELLGFIKDCQTIVQSA